VLGVNPFAKPMRFHPHAYGNVRLVDEFQPAHQRIKRVQQLCLGKIRTGLQSLLMLEQLDEKKAWTEKLWMSARANPFSQIAPTRMKAPERYVSINNDAIGVHRSPGGMNLSLFAA